MEKWVGGWDGRGNWKGTIPTDDGKFCRHPLHLHPIRPRNDVLAGVELTFVVGGAPVNRRRTEREAGGCRLEKEEEKNVWDLVLSWAVGVRGGRRASVRLWRSS